jgi:hypothetical protein
LVEAEDESTPDYRERVEAGAYFQRQLAAAGLGKYQQAFTNAHAFDAAVFADPAFAADPLLLAVARRSPDGLALQTTAQALPRYLDLPVYDYVRQDTFEESAGEAQPILLLRAFHKYDAGGRLNTVETGIRKAFDLSGDARVESVIDQQSPRLAGQRLYEAIRHWRRCVVDVTWWRANVMFELGVRLATHPQGTFCLLDETVAAAGPVGSEKLKQFLGVKGYTLKAYGFEHKFTSEAAGFGEIHDTAAQHFRTAQDGYDQLVDVELVAEAEATQRKNAQQQVDIAPLYGSKNAAFGNETLSSALEKWCAAWCYLVERERPQKLRPIDLLDERCADSFRRFRRMIRD